MRPTLYRYMSNAIERSNIRLFGPPGYCASSMTRATRSFYFCSRDCLQTMRDFYAPHCVRMRYVYVYIENGRKADARVFALQQSLIKKIITRSITLAPLFVYIILLNLFRFSRCFARFCCVRVSHAGSLFERLFCCVG